MVYKNIDYKKSYSLMESIALTSNTDVKSVAPLNEYKSLVIEFTSGLVKYFNTLKIPSDSALNIFEKELDLVNK